MTKEQKPRRIRAKGRTAAEQFATAQRRIQEARESGSTKLDLAGLSKLAELPAEISSLAALQNLSLDGTAVSNLAPLAGLTALEDLSLNSTAVSDLAPIAGLTALEGLSLNSTAVSDLAPIAGLAALRFLELDNTIVRDLVPIRSLDELIVLSLDQTFVSDLSSLAGKPLRNLWLANTEVSDLRPLSDLTTLYHLGLSRTYIRDLRPISGLIALKTLWLDFTDVRDLGPIANLTELTDLRIDNTPISDLAPTARLTALQERVTQVEMKGGFTSAGLSYRDTPVAESPLFLRLVRLREPARTVETINQVRRQLGLPEHIPEGYERSDTLLPELVPPSEPLPTPGPATRFALVGGRIDIVPPEVWGDLKNQAATYHARARKLAAALAERLSKTDAVPDVAASVAALGDVLGENVESVQPDQLRLASRSIAARARAYGHPAAQWEISPDSVSAIFELADLLIDLQGFAKTDIEANERAIRQLDLTPDQAAAAKVALDEIAAAIETIPEVVTDRVETTFANAALLSGSSIETDVKVAVEGERILLTENLALSVARGIDGSGGTQPARTGAPLADDQREPAKPRRRQRRPTLAARELTWDEFRDRLLKRLREKAPERMADAALDAAVSTIKHSPKTITGLGAALVLWSATTPIAIGGGLALTMAWIGYQLAKRKEPKD